MGAEPRDRAALSLRELAAFFLNGGESLDRSTVGFTQRHRVGVSRSKESWRAVARLPPLQTQGVTERYCRVTCLRDGRECYHVEL